MRINGSTPRELAVEIEGDGPAVLMVHGLGGTSNFYQVQAQALAERFRVIRVDSASTGRSPLADGISIESHAEDLAALLDQLGVSGATVVGHSMGTLVVRTLAARRPALVSRLVLLGAVAEPADAARQAQRDHAATLRKDGTAAVAPGVVANALSGTTRRDKPEVAAFVRELIMRQDPEELRPQLRSPGRRHRSRPGRPEPAAAADHRQRREDWPARGQPGHCERLRLDHRHGHRRHRSLDGPGSGPRRHRPPVRVP